MCWLVTVAPARDGGPSQELPAGSCPLTGVMALVLAHLWAHLLLYRGRRHSAPALDPSVDRTGQCWRLYRALEKPVCSLCVSVCVCLCLSLLLCVKSVISMFCLVVLSIVRQWCVLAHTPLNSFVAFELPLFSILYSVAVFIYFRAELQVNVIFYLNSTFFTIRWKIS